jgi:hypothetical protein
MLIFLALLRAEQCVAVKLAADPAQWSITALLNFAAWLSAGPNGSMELFRMESFRIDFLAKPKSFRMESFRRNLSENNFSKTEMFQNGIIQK